MSNRELSDKFHARIEIRCEFKYSPTSFLVQVLSRATAKTGGTNETSLRGI